MSINFVKKSLSLKLVLFILLGTGSILFGVGWYGYFCSKSILRDELISRVDGIGELVADRVDRITLVVETVARDMGLSLFMHGRSSESLFPLLESVVMAHEEVAGLCVAFLPRKDEAPFAPLVYKDGGGLHSKDFGQGGTDFSSASWYRIPIESRSPFWTEPYFGYGGSERFVITYSVPAFGPKGDLIAVVACDLSLDWLADVMDSLDIPGGGKGFVVGSDGTFLSHENRDLLNRESLSSLGLKAGDEGLLKLGEKMVRGERGIVAIEDRDDDGWIVYRPIGDMGWSLGLFFPKTAVTGHLNNLLISQIALASIGMILLLFVAWAISRAITGPIRVLSCATERMSSGDFDFPLPHTSGEDEVAQLARSFSSMRESLIAHIERLKETTAARERMESELSIARSIQMSLVPRTFPPFPEKDGLDLFAVLDPAREVSGDFYDFLMLDDDNILITVGDVSGKGLPAALFKRHPIRGAFREISSGGRFSMVNVHLQSLGIAGSKDKLGAVAMNNGIRQAQVIKLNHIAEDSEIATFILGDFNSVEVIGATFPILPMPEGFSYDDLQCTIDHIGYVKVVPDGTWSIREVETSIPERASGGREHPDHDMVILSMPNLFM